MAGFPSFEGKGSVSSMAVWAPDIVSNHWVEESFRENQDLYRALVESMDDSVIVKDLEGKYLLANAESARRRGICPQDYIGKSDTDFYSADIVRVGEEEDRRVIATGIPLAYDRRGFSCTAPEWVNVRKVPLYDQDGKVFGIVVVIRDITAQKRTQEDLAQALHLSDQRNAEITAFLTGARAVAEYQEFPPAVHGVFEACKALLRATAGYVALLSKDSNQNEVIFMDPGDGLCSADPTLLVPVKGLSEGVYRSGKAAYDNDSASSQWCGFLPAGRPAVPNILFAPLILEGTPVGLLALANKQGGFTDRDADLATFFGELAAVALRNSRNLEKLKTSETVYRTLVENVNDVIHIKDAGLRYRAVNSEMCRRLGLAREQIIGKTARELYATLYNTEVGEQVMAGDRRVMKTGRPVESIDEFPGPNGARYSHVKKAPIKNQDGTFAGLVTVSRDVTEQKRTEQIIKDRAYHDALTGLPNRLLLEDRLRMEISRAQRTHHHLALMFVDLDHFKLVNDTLGHTAGDDLLYQIAYRLVGLLRQSDTVARQGGDEFIILIPDVYCPDGPEETAQRLLEGFHQPFLVAGQPINVSLSIGAAVFPEDSRDIGVLLRQADAAMYQVKQDGRNGYRRWQPSFTPILTSQTKGPFMTLLAQASKGTAIG
jgi:diguanylate cyclase (GGDEF)-like protein/PAS domain S-box-containing protein